MRSHPVVVSLAFALPVVVAAFGGAVAADGLFGVGPVAISITVAVVLAGLFAVRPAEGLLAFAIAILLADTVESWTALDLRYVDELSVPLLIVVGLVAHRRRLVVPRPGVREWALITLVVAGVVSSLAASVPGFIWIPSLGLLLKSFAFFYLVLVLPLSSDELHRIAGAFLAIALAIMAIGLLQFVAPDIARATFGLPPFEQQRGSIQVVHSLFTHPALYGWLAVFLSLFLFARFTVLREWWALGLALVLGGASLLTGRRAPIVGLVFGTLAGILREALAGRRVLRLLGLTLAGSLVLGALSVPLLGDFYESTLREYGESPDVLAEIFADDPDAEVISTVHPRLALYTASIAIAADELPLGAGLGRFGSHMSRVQYSPVYETYGLNRIVGLTPGTPIAVTDTFWPMLLGEIGIVGLLAALVFFGTLLRDTWGQAGRRNVANRAFSLGVVLILVEALVRSVVSPALVAPPISYIVLGTVGIGIATHRRDTEPVASPPPAADAAG